MKIHIAGFPLRVRNQARQLCAWCGEKLIDVDLENTMVAPGCDSTLRFWEMNALVAHDGPGMWVVPHEEGAPLPLQSCAVEKPILRAVE